MTVEAPTGWKPLDPPTGTRQLLLALLNAEYGEEGWDDLRSLSRIAQAVNVHFEKVPATLGEMAEVLRTWRDNDITRGAIDYVIDQVWYDDYGLRAGEIQRQREQIQRLQATLDHREGISSGLTDIIKRRDEEIASLKTEIRRLQALKSAPSVLHWD